MTFAGTPAATHYAGISFATTEFAPIIAPRPIVTPGKTLTASPIHTSSSMITGPLDTIFLFDGGT